MRLAEARQSSRLIKGYRRPMARLITRLGTVPTPHMVHCLLLQPIQEILNQSNSVLKDAHGGLENILDGSRYYQQLGSL